VKKTDVLSDLVELAATKVTRALDKEAKGVSCDILVGIWRSAFCLAKARKIVNNAQL